LGIEEVVGQTAGTVGEGPVFLSVDIDVLDPAFAPGTGTPEPGGMETGDLLWACRAIASKLELVGAEVVEVIPTAVGSADTTALALQVEERFDSGKTDGDVGRALTPGAAERVADDHADVRAGQLSQASAQQGGRCIRVEREQDEHSGLGRVRCIHAGRGANETV